ncbi:MAG: fluoride efflux transporter CrcB [Pseudomonadota bacterium]
MISFVLVALGGALGAMARFGTTSASARLFGHGFPIGTMVVNVVGSLVMGLIIGWLASRSAGDQSFRMFFVTGFLGSFTTFSAFSLDFATLYERGALSLAMGYAVTSVLASIAAVFVGLALSRSLLG